MQRLSQQKVTQADSQTIINAIHTWKELAHFQEDRGLEVIEDLDLASFIQEGTDGPVRALASLKWLNKAGTMGWTLTNIQIIPGRHRAGGASALIRAVMMGETFEEASDWIAQRMCRAFAGTEKRPSGYKKL